VTGFVVPEGDESLLTKRLCELLLNRELTSGMGQAARQRAGSLFCLYDKALQICDVYLALKQGRHLP
jgi:glycosyltransferase involved in cell wall biosynthesis